MAPRAVMLRRRPSNWAQFNLWHTDSDVVQPGQWVSARIYERRWKVSLFVQFARRSSGPAATGQPADSWIPIGRPPWFRALALWWFGGTYGGGGFLPTGRTFTFGGLTAPPDDGKLPSWLSICRDLPYVDGTPSWTDRSTWFNRLLWDS